MKAKLTKDLPFTFAMNDTEIRLTCLWISGTTTFGYLAAFFDLRGQEAHFLLSSPITPKEGENILKEGFDTTQGPPAQRILKRMQKLGLLEFC